MAGDRMQCPIGTESTGHFGAALGGCLCSEPSASHLQGERKAPLLQPCSFTQSWGGCQQGVFARERILARSDFQLGNALYIHYLRESVEKAEQGWQWVAIKYIAAIIIITVEKAGTRISLREADEEKYKQNTSST